MDLLCHTSGIIAVARADARPRDGPHADEKAVHRDKEKAPHRCGASIYLVASEGLEPPTKGL